jgi:hypothetical protein
MRKHDDDNECPVGQTHHAGTGPVQWPKGAQDEDFRINRAGGNGGAKVCHGSGGVGSLRAA